jgi:hypothetical protein
MKVTSKPANVIVPVLLFIVLSPGLFLTLPSKKATTIAVVLTHAVLFGLIYALLLSVFPEYY